MLWKPQFHCHIPHSPPIVSIPSKTNPVQYFPYHFSKIHFNIIHPSNASSSKSFISFRLTHKNQVRASPVLHTRYISGPSSSFHYVTLPNTLQTHDHGSNCTNSIIFIFRQLSDSQLLPVLKRIRKIAKRDH